MQTAEPPAVFQRGFDNVDAFRKEHQKAAQPQQPQEPPMKGGLNISSKLEMLPPELQNAILQAAGLPPVPMAPPPQPPPEAGPEPGSPPPPEDQESPLPPPPPEGGDMEMAA
jgi:hypothetical protein